MKINTCMKVYMNETHRSETLEKTYSKVKDQCSKIGVTRIADITDLDRIGIPVYSCIRPESMEGSISVYNGKGSTKIAAKVSSIMESIERFSAEINDNNQKNIIYDSYTSLSSQNIDVLNPIELILPNQFNYDKIIPWSKGYSIDEDTLECTEILIPSNAIFHPLLTKHSSLFRTNTNGLASGNTIEEALFHGLCEVIERDAWSVTEYTKDSGSIITNIDDVEIKKLVNMFESSGVNIILRNITKDISIPTIAAVSDDILTRDPTMLCLGIGTHSDPKIATIRALTEVAQSRVTQIHGAREDTIIGDFRKQIGYDKTKKLNKKWFENESTCNYRDLSKLSASNIDFKEEIKNIVSKLKDVGMHKIIFCNLTNPTINIPVVRVIIPGLEVYSIDSERIGNRCKNYKKKYKYNNLAGSINI